MKLLLLCRILSHIFVVNTGTLDGQVYGHTQKNNCYLERTENQKQKSSKSERST